MLTAFYDKVALKVEYEGQIGSGVLCSNVQKESSYLITAWHCLNSQVDIHYENIKTFRQVEGKMQEVTLAYKDKIILEHNDIIILILDFMEDIPIYWISELEVREDVSIVGFPKGFSSGQSSIARYALRGQVNELPGNDIIQINCTVPIETYESDAQNIVSQSSGSGIFIESDKQVYLVGIVTELGSPQGAFSVINGVMISKIDDELCQFGGVHLPNIKWCSFDEFVQSTLEIFDEPLMEICSVQIPEITRSVTPNNIVERCGNKIVWPYSVKGILKKEVWEAWLLYLIIRCIESHENMKDENYYMIRDEDNNRQVKLYYATNHIKLPDFLKDYMQNAYCDINNGELMIVGTQKPPTKKVLPADKVEQIVSDISSTICAEQHLYIDEIKNSMQRISIIHIQKLVDEMAKFVEEHEDDSLTGRELERKLSERVWEVLHGF